jgi:hypothetical protein
VRRSGFAQLSITRRRPLPPRKARVAAPSRKQQHGTPDYRFLFSCHWAPSLTFNPAPVAAARDAAAREPNRLWCEEHGIYEDECTLCHPELAKAEPQPTAGALLCDEHRVPESECGICHPELVSTLAPGHGLKIRFASAESAAKAGVQTATSEVGAISDGVECYAEISFNQNKLAHVAAPVRSDGRTTGNTEGKPTPSDDCVCARDGAPFGIHDVGTAGGKLLRAGD